MGSFVILHDDVERYLGCTRLLDNLDNRYTFTAMCLRLVCLLLARYDVSLAKLITRSSNLIEVVASSSH